MAGKIGILAASILTCRPSSVHRYGNSSGGFSTGTGPRVAKQDSCPRHTPPSFYKCATACFFSQRNQRPTGVDQHTSSGSSCRAGGPAAMSPLCLRVVVFTTIRLPSPMIVVEMLEQDGTKVQKSRRNLDAEGARRDGDPVVAVSTLHDARRTIVECKRHPEQPK